DLITMRAHVYTRKTDGKFGGYALEDVPEQLVDEAKRLRTRLVEAVAETDDAMLEAYLDGREPGEEMLIDGIAHAVLGRRFLPVLACAARPGIDGNRTTEIPEAAAGEIVGLMKLKDVHVGDTLCSNDSPILRLDMIPRPQRVIAYALKIDREQEEKVGVALHRLLEEDPSLEMVRDPETNETLLRGMGQVHIEVAVEKLKRKFDVDVHLELPHPAYHETVT